MELIAEWKTLSQKFAHSAAVAYKAMWNTLREKFGDVRVTDSFRQLAEIAASLTLDTFWDRKWGTKLMTQLAVECKAADWAVIEWLMQKPLLPLLKRHNRGLRRMQGLNRKIAKDLEKMTRPSRGAGLPDRERTQRVKSKLVELSKVMEHQTTILACLDLKVEDIGKLNLRTKFAISKVTNASFKVFKSFRTKSIPGLYNSAVPDVNTDINGNHQKAENLHEQGDSQTKKGHPARAVVSLKTGDSPDIRDTIIIGDSPICGEFPKVRVIHVKPLYSDDAYDNAELGIPRTDSCESSSSSCRNDRSTLVHLASSPVHSPTGSQTFAVQRDELRPKSLSPLNNSPISSDQPSRQWQASSLSYNGDRPQKIESADQHLTKSDRAPPHTAQPLSEQSEVYVRVVKAYQAQKKNELSLKIGQILKQKTPADSDGFALGWTRRHRFAFKRRGFYPVDCVELISSGKKKD